MADHTFHRCKQGKKISSTTPDDHFIRSPHSCLRAAGIRRIGGAGGRPTIRTWIIPTPVFSPRAFSSAPPQIIISLPVHTAV